MKIAFINQRYGLEVNGGSEYYTRLMAEHLVKYHEVEVLTTKAKDYLTWKNEYEQDTESINGVVVRRFGVKRERNIKSFVWMDKLRNHLPCKITEQLWIKAQGPYVPELTNYIIENKENYDVFIFVTYLYYTTAMGLPVVREKAVLIPTAHDEPYIYFRCYRNIFRSPAGIIYLTPEEKEMVERIFQNGNISNATIGVGVDMPDKVNSSEFREKYGIIGEYFIYAGRVDSSKGCGELFEYYRRYSMEETEIQLVLIGKQCMEIPELPRMKVLGFVSEKEKYQAIAGSKALILPSHFESLSIAVLEAMKMGIPVVVNGKCEVLKGHCLRSSGGQFYTNYKEFADCLNRLEGNNYGQMSRNAKKYVEENYAWETIEMQFCQFLQGCL